MREDDRRVSRPLYDSDKEDIAAVDCSVQALVAGPPESKTKGTNLMSAAQIDSATTQLASTDAFFSMPQSHHWTHSSSSHPASISPTAAGATQHSAIWRIAAPSPSVSQVPHFSSLVVENSENRLSSCQAKSITISTRAQ